MPVLQRLKPVPGHAMWPHGFLNIYIIGIFAVTLSCIIQSLGRPHRRLFKAMSRRVVAEKPYYAFIMLRYPRYFFGRVSVGYIPDGEMIGLSKLARAVNVYARRLQVQERLTAEICASLGKIEIVIFVKFLFHLSD